MVSEILCHRCGEPLAEDDRGRYYAHVCRDCCEKHGLCADCGGPVILTPEQRMGGFACTGWHHAGYSKLEGDIIITKREVDCPKCGHKFEVSRY